MGVFAISLYHHCRRNFSFNYHYQSCRTLILQSAFESVRVQRLSHDDSGKYEKENIELNFCLSRNPIWFNYRTEYFSGIVEVHLDRPEAKNAIGKEMLRGLQNIFEAINRDASANVVMLSSSVPRVFCAGADLKVKVLGYEYWASAVCWFAFKNRWN